jgi:hypothetical protein
VTESELTALLAPVRAELDAIEQERRTVRARSQQEVDQSEGMRQVMARIRAVLNKLTPPAPAELDPMVVLGIAALGMLRELRESEALGRARAGFSSTANGEDWNERADALLAAAYSKG